VPSRPRGHVREPADLIQRLERRPGGHETVHVVSVKFQVPSSKFPSSKVQTGVIGSGEVCSRLNEKRQRAAAVQDASRGSRRKSFRQVLDCGSLCRLFVANTAGRPQFESAPFRLEAPGTWNLELGTFPCSFCG